MNIKPFISTARTKLKILEEGHQQYGKILAPHFNSFDFWWIDEDKVSEIIRFFLDPNENHEQGDRFLKVFFSRLGITYPFREFKMVRSETNYLTYEGRKIDIVIYSLSDDYMLGIENKIYLWTQDQDNQLRDYLSDMKLKTGGKFCLLYLAPKGKEPAESSISIEDRENYINSGHLKLISYEDIMLECLHEFSLQCEAERVRYFIIDFEKKLKRMYFGEKSMDENEILAGFSLEDPENLEIALKISNAVEVVKNELRQMLDIQVKEIAQELNIRDKGKDLFPSNWKRHSISFSFEQGGLIYGLKRTSQDPSRSRIPEIEQRTGKSWNVSQWWPMWQFLYRDIDHNPEIWLDIKTGVFKQKAREFVKIFVENFNTDKY